MSRVIVFRARGDNLERLPIDAASLDEATLQTAHGVYTVMRLHEGRRVFRLAQHWARLRKSAELLGSPFDLSDGWLRLAVRNAVEQSGLALARVRLTVPFDAPDTAFISLEAFTPPSPDLFEQGVRVGLVTGEREAPLAKNSTFIEWRNRMVANQPPDVYETLLVDQTSVIREGVGSNFYAVIAGRLRTAPAGMLEGIARGVLLDVAPSIIAVEPRAVHVDELPSASEAMLTSASRGVVPIVQVGDTAIGGGRPGPVAKALRAAYDAQVNSELESL